MKVRDIGEWSVASGQWSAVASLPSPASGRGAGGEGGQLHRVGRPRATRRRGAVLLMVLVVGTVLTLVLFGILHRIAGGAKQLRGQQDRAQAIWLAEAALERAAVRLAADPSYVGETWQLPPQRLDGRRAGRVAIVVEPLSGQPRQRLVRVVADFPDHPQERTRQSKQVVLELP